jgi:hypothetical protein
MNKGGRPRKNGMKDASVFFRSMFALLPYYEARKSGEKHEAAVALSVSAMAPLRPQFKTSKTEVNRILRDWRGKDDCVKDDACEGGSARLNDGDHTPKLVIVPERTVVSDEEHLAFEDKFYQAVVSVSRLKGKPAPARVTMGRNVVNLSVVSRPSLRVNAKEIK